MYDARRGASLAILLLFSATAAQAAQDEYKLTHTNASIDDEVSSLIDRSHCAKQTHALLQSWEATGQWVRQPGDMDGGRMFGSPTTKIGTWVGVAVYPSGIIEAHRLSPDSAVRVTWDQASCAPKVKPRVLTADHRAGFEYVTDADLETAAASGPVLVYNWSPHMPLSVKGFAEAQELAKRLNLRFVPVLDPEADATTARKAVENNRMPAEALKRADSIELAARGTQLHYPSTLVIAKRHFSRLYPGLWVSVKAYEKFVKEALR